MKDHTALAAHQAMNAAAIFHQKHPKFHAYFPHISWVLYVSFITRKRDIRGSNICFARYVECAKRLSRKTHIRAKKINPRGVCGVSLRRTT
jgi:hypothetical protein